MNHFEWVEFKDKSTLQYAARCKTLGLTAYGYTMEEARANLVKMFQSFVEMEFRHNPVTIYK